MLAYAYTALRPAGYRKVCTEAFEHVGDLYAAILIKGMQDQLKRGVVRCYTDQEEEMSCLRGKLLIGETLRNQSLRRGRAVCRHSEFTEDNEMNRILCSTAEHLARTGIADGRKKQLHGLLQHFPHVTRIPLRRINWKLRFNRQNKTYQMLIGICKLVVHGLLQGEQEGDNTLMAFEDEQQMSRLYERFILEYYRTTYPALEVSAAHIDWHIEEGDSSLLPTLRTDITIRSKPREKTLIIDAKYYTHILKEYYGAARHDRANLTQILNYVDQESHAAPGEQVTGMLLYAGTDESQCVEKEFVTCGKRIDIRILDLDADFSRIQTQLDAIIRRYFPAARTTA